MTNDEKSLMTAAERAAHEYGVRWRDENPAWFSVDERLPKTPGYYMVVKEVMPEQERKQSCAFWTGERWDTIFEVEHWLPQSPLPAVPAKEAP